MVRIFYILSLEQEDTCCQLVKYRPTQIGSRTLNCWSSGTSLSVSVTGHHSGVYIQCCRHLSALGVTCWEQFIITSLFFVPQRNSLWGRHLLHRCNDGGRNTFFIFPELPNCITRCCWCIIFPNYCCQGVSCALAALCRNFCHMGN